MYSYADLEGLLKPGKIRLNESLARHTTFRMGGRADALCLPETRYDLLEVIGWASLHGIPWLLIGNGSNVIFDDEVMNEKLYQYDWLHLHHEDFTGQYGKFFRYRNKKDS